MRYREEGIFLCFRVKCSVDICQIICFITSFSFTVSLFSFCFHDLSIGQSGVLKSTTIIVSVLSFSSISFTNVGDLAFGLSKLRVQPGRFFL